MSRALLGMGALFMSAPLFLTYMTTEQGMFTGMTTLVSAGLISLTAATAFTLSVYEYKPLHNFEYVCAKDAAKIIP